MKIFKTKDFVRAARRTAVSDGLLRDAILRAERGLIDADLGAHLIKQRVARAGTGRSGGYRTIIFYAEGVRAVFLYMFPKSRRSNLTASELDSYREFAGRLASLSGDQLRVLVTQRGWVEIDGAEP